MLKEKLEENVMLIVGIGEEWAKTGSSEELSAAYTALAGILKGRNYFIISECTDEYIYDFGFDAARIVLPCLADPESLNESEEWKRYTSFLQGTLGKKTLLLELGCSFSNPELIRFPFEKMAYFNQKSELIRVNSHVYQVPSEAKERCTGIKASSVRWIGNEIG